MDKLLNILFSILKKTASSLVILIIAACNAAVVYLAVTQTLMSLILLSVSIYLSVIFIYLVFGWAWLDKDYFSYEYAGYSSREGLIYKNTSTDSVHKSMYLVVAISYFLTAIFSTVAPIILWSKDEFAFFGIISAVLCVLFGLISLNLKIMKEIKLKNETLK
jgi:hypothetical protein